MKRLPTIICGLGIGAASVAGAGVAELAGPRPDLAIEELGVAADAASVPLLLPFAAADDGELRAQAAWALGRCDAGAARTVLLQLLADGSPDVRAAAVLALATQTGPAIDAALAGLLDDPVISVRLAVCLAVRRSALAMRCRMLFPLLDYRLQSAPHEPTSGETEPARVDWHEAEPQVRLAAIQTLAAIGEVDVIPALIAALERETSFNRLHIMAAIERFGTAAAPVCLGRIVPLPYDQTAFREHLPLLLNNSTLAVLAGRLGDDRCVPWLRQTLKLPRQQLGRDKDLTEIYIETVKLLGVFRVEQAARPLAELLNETRIAQLAAAIEISLRQIGFAAARPLAESLRDWQLAPTFLRLLRDPGLRHAAAADVVATYLTHESDEVRFEAMETLGLYIYEGIFDEYEIPKLEGLVYDPNEDVRVGAQRWLARIRQRQDGGGQP